MKNLRLVALLIVLGIVSGFSQDSSPVDSRFTAAIETYEADYAAKVDAEYEKKLGQLNGQLDLALSREEEKAVQAGNLDLVTAIQAERKTLDKNLAVPADGDDAAPVVINRFRIAWREQKAALDHRMQAAATAINAALSKQLQELEKTLTQERKIQEALAVRKYRESNLTANASPRPPSGHGGDWQTIFDGTSLFGWHSDQPKAFQLVDGGLEARKTGPVAAAGYLFYVGADRQPEVFQNFEIRLRLHAKDLGSANSGFFYHVPLDALENPLADGLEINIANQNTLMNQTGSIFGIKAVQKPLLGQKESYVLLIRITESEIVVSARGKEVMRHDPTAGKKAAYRPGGGAIALQANSIDSTYVFEKIEIRRLD